MRQAAIRSSIALAAMAMASPVALAAPQAPAPAASAAATSAAPAASAAPAGPSKPLADACPAQLAVKQTVSETIAGWTPLNQQGSYPFVRVAFYPGPPVDGSLIVPTLEYKGQAGLHDSWDLPHREGGYWMTCSYANTTATVSRKLADDTDYCRADYDGRFLTLVVKHWACGVKRTMPAPAWTRPVTRSGTKPAGRPPIKRVE
ncbi:MAG: STY0301 family protein [Vitreoscilla sp.]